MNDKVSKEVNGQENSEVGIAKEYLQEPASIQEMYEEVLKHNSLLNYQRIFYSEIPANFESKTAYSISEISNLT